MRVLMLGWEFPPFISGGLGTACHGLTKGLDKIGVQVLFVLPRPVAADDASHVTLITPCAAPALSLGEESYEREGNGGSQAGFRVEHGLVHFHPIDVALFPYARPENLGTAESPVLYEGTATEWYQVLVGSGAGGATPRRVVAPAAAPSAPTQTIAPVVPARGDHYAGDLFSEAQRYARLVVAIARRENFDVIHAHDWMTFPAGAAVAEATGKPLVIHVHSTEFDRSGEHVNQRIYDTERMGMHRAKRIIAVSFLTRNVLITRYGVDAGKIRVVYNALDQDEGPRETVHDVIRPNEKIVLFLGRITMQKGPEYFLMAAKKVLERFTNVRFIMAGSGDMITRSIQMAADMGIGHKVLFTGFLRGRDVERVFRMADLYVMPSVSEPFGIAPLEAMSHDVPVLISKQSGVSEVLTHVLKVDFWDVNAMADKILAVLRHPPLQLTLRHHGTFEVRKLRWEDSARKCREVYESAM